MNFSKKIRYSFRSKIFLHMIKNVIKYILSYRHDFTNYLITNYLKINNCVINTRCAT